MRTLQTHLHGSSSGGPDMPPSRLLAGRSSQGRPIWLETLTPLTDRPRVLIVAGQHGDEVGGPLSLERLVGHDRQRVEALGIGVAAIADANPDGHAAVTRTTSEGIDLNRDHFQLRAPETQAVHRVLRSLFWDVVLDLHTYPSRRVAAARHGWILDDDILLGTATVPAVLDRPPLVTERGLLADLAPAWKAAGIAGGGYRLFQRSGRVRRSTMAPVDLRNVAALRYGAFSLLVEGRSPRSDDAAGERARLVSAQATTTLALLQWVSGHRALFPGVRRIPRGGDRVAVKARWARSGVEATATVQEITTRVRRTVAVPEFHDLAEVTRSIELPEAYAVPPAASEIGEALARQGFEWEPDSRWGARYPGRIHPGDRVFPVAQPGGEALAVWIESSPFHPSSSTGPADPGGMSPGEAEPQQGVRRIPY